MARIRTIKPEFPQSESMGRVSREARLLFVQMWTLADDEGRLRANSRMLASLLYPYDDDVPGLIDAWLEELEREHCIVRYTADGQHYLEISKWLNHQKIDHASKSKIPPPRETDVIPREPSRILALDQGSRKGSRKGGDRGGEQPTRAPKGSRLPDDWVLPDDLLEWSLGAYPGATPEDILRTLARFRDYWRAAPGAKGVRADWNATWRNWVRREAETAPKVSKPAERRLAI